MTTRQIIKSIPFTNGELFGTVERRRKKIAECEPVIEIYRQDNPVTVLGRTSYALKSYHAALVICGGPDLAPGVDYEFIQKITAYELAAKVMLRGNIIKEYFFRNMYPDVIDPRGEWVFIMEDQGLVDELLALDIL